MRTLLVPALCLATAAACAGIPAVIPPTGTGTGAGTAGSPASVAADVVRYTNEARARNGLPILASNARLMEAARIHAEQMAAHQQMAHTISGAKYPTLASRLDAAGYVYSRAAENVAWNSQSAQNVVIGWMNSSGHRANIVDARLREMGAAMARSSKGEPYWIQVFGTPR